MILIADISPEAINVQSKTLADVGNSFEDLEICVSHAVMTTTNKFQNPILKGVGKVTAASHKSRKIAIGSAFGLLTQPQARAAYAGQSLRYRVAIYVEKSQKPIAWYDSVKFPINDIAFHPTDPVVAIATGSYDGGYSFEGELVVWNWETNEVSHEMAETPEVFRVAFSEGGKSIICAVRPWDDNDFELGDKIFDMFYVIRLTYTANLELGVVNAKAVNAQMMAQPVLTMSQLELDDKFKRNASSIDTVQQFFGKNTHTRSSIWDVSILENEQIGIVHDGTHLEVFDVQGDLVHSFSGDGHGVQILKSAKPIVHVTNPVKSVSNKLPLDTRLLQFVNEDLVEKLNLEGSFTFSISQEGTVLGRRDRSGALEQSKDLITNFDFEAVKQHDLGHFDVFNHFIRIDNAPQNFIVQGNPSVSSQFKVIATVDKNMNVTKLWPIISGNVPSQKDKEAIQSEPWNPLHGLKVGTYETHAMECFFTYVSDNEGEGLLGTGTYFNPKPESKGFFYRKGISDGRKFWSHDVGAACSVMKQIPSMPVAIAAFLDGTVLVLRTDTGKILHKTDFKINGLPSIIFSLDCSRSFLVLGTVTGEVASLNVDKVLEKGISDVLL